MRLVGEIPFDDVPRYLIAADVVAVPQRATTDTRRARCRPSSSTRWRSAGPIVSTAVSMIPEILDGCGVVVPPGDVAALAGAMRAAPRRSRRSAAELGRRARERCQARYSFAAARAALFPVVERALASPAAMKILIVSRPFVFHGGVERATAGFVAALVAHGHDVHLLSPPRPGAACRA